MAGVKVLISSVRHGYEHYRTAVREAVESRGHRVVELATEPGPGEPEKADLAGVREADVVILLIGGEYGAFQRSGLSAPHEEFREAKAGTPILVFVESRVGRGATQQAFLDEVAAWATGPFHGSFADSAQLRSLVLRAIYRYALAMSTYAVDEESLLERARNMLPSRQRTLEGPTLVLAIAGSPYQQVLDEAEVEARDLARDVQREAMLGRYPIFEEAAATSVAVRSGELLLAQQGVSIVLNQTGDLRLARSLKQRGKRSHLEIEALIEEEIMAGLAHLMRFGDWLLDRVDPLRRLTDLVVIAEIAGAAAMPWRTRAEHAANPRQGSMGSGSNSVVAVPHPPHRHRQALALDADRMAEDLTTLLRRQVRTLNAPAVPREAEPAPGLLRRLLDLLTSLVRLGRLGRAHPPGE